MKKLILLGALLSMLTACGENVQFTTEDPGPKGEQGTPGSDGKNGTNGNSHLDNVKSISFSEKASQLEITIGEAVYRFTPAK